MNVYEVFLKKDGKEEFRHVGALEAATEDLALVLARESYVRRAEGDRLWVVRRDHVIAADEDFVAPNADKPHRHHDGAAVASRRKAARKASASSPSTSSSPSESELMPRTTEQQVR